MMEETRRSGGNGSNKVSPDVIEEEIARTRGSIDETLSELETRISPSAWVDQGLRYVREHGGTFASNAGRTMRDNPVPLALIGVGLAWMMMAGRGSDEARRGSRSSDPYRADPCRPADTEDRASYAAYAARTATAATEGDDIADDEASEGPGVAGRAREKAAATGRDASHRVGDAARHTRERVAEAYQGGLGRARDVRHRGSEIGRRGMEAAGGSVHAAQSFFRDHPLALGALALGAGAALAALFPTSQREHDILGEESDRLKGAVRDAATEGMERAKRAGTAAVDAGREEALGRQSTGEPDSERTDRATTSAAAEGSTAGRYPRDPGFSPAAAPPPVNDPAIERQTATRGTEQARTAPLGPSSPPPPKG